MPRKLRAKLWELFDHIINIKYLGGKFVILPPWNAIIYRSWINLDGNFGDTLPDSAEKQKAYVRDKFYSGNYATIYDFIQFALQTGLADERLHSAIDNILKKELAAYRVFDRDIIAPIGSEADAETITAALSKASELGANGARAHLRNAVSALNESDFSGSVRESISAVESIAKILAEDPKTELSKALSKLEKSANIHGGMRTAFNSLYGYTSDEKGVRHSLLFNEKANVDEADALFMIGACSAFVTYLISRAVDAGLSVSSTA